MLLFGAATFLLPLLSRLTTVWPDALNVRDKNWWLAEPHRLNELERRLRNDLWVLTASLLARGLTPVLGHAESSTWCWEAR